jgi:hypothetical protein
MAKRLVVWLTIDPEQEEAFNRWYQEDYIPRFVRQIPGIQAVTRWCIPATTTYLTVYELDPDLTMDELTAALRNPDREADRAAWGEWEEVYLTDFRDGFFERVFEYRPDSGE